MAGPPAPFTASVWRMIHPAYQRAPFSGEGARLYGGRWNLKAWPALYLALDHATAVAEFYQGVAKPGMLVPYRIEAAAIVDLTADPRANAALDEEWKTIARIEGQVPDSWALAQQLIAGDAEGALVRSVQNSGGRVLVLWRWRDADAAGEGARLTLLDPEATLRAPGAG